MEDGQPQHRILHVLTIERFHIARGKLGKTGAYGENRVIEDDTRIHAHLPSRRWRKCTSSKTESIDLVGMRCVPSGCKLEPFTEG